MMFHVWGKHDCDIEQYDSTAAAHRPLLNVSNNLPPFCFMLAQICHVPMDLAIKC
jgi:hypothetical protein